MTPDQFFSIPNGTQIKNHGWDQCVALANLYNEGVIGGEFVPVPSAYMWWTGYGAYPQVHETYTAHTTPQAGDIFVSRGGIYNSLDGHIGVVVSVNPDGTFNTMEQNAGTWRYVGRYVRTMQDMLGFLRPRKSQPTPPSQKGLAKDMFMVYFKNGNPQGGKGWVVVGTPSPEVLITQSQANQVARAIGANAVTVGSQSGWEKYLRMAGFTRTQIKKMYGK